MRVPKFRKTPALLAAGAGLTLSLALLLGLQQRARNEQREAARHAVHERAEVLRTHVLRSLEALHGIGALFTVREEVSREEFRAYVAGALARQSELQALAWDARVPQAGRTAQEQRARGEGFPDFGFRIEMPTGTMIPAPPRAEYFPVLYLEPLAPNRDAFGFDVGSEPLRRHALEIARDSGAAAATAPLRLAQEKGAQLGFLVFEPIYRGSPASVAERREALRGFAVAVFRIGDLVSASLRGARLLPLQLTLTDIDSGVPIYGAPVRDAVRQPPTAGELFEIAGRHWRLTTSTPIAANGWAPWAAFAGGVLFTGLLAAYLWGSQRSAAELATSNAALLEEVTVRQRAEAAAESANHAKSEFLANMSHEIRTPMNAILGYAQILARNPGLHPFQRDAIATISNSCDHLLHLVNDILDLSKIDAGHMEVAATTFDLSALLRQLVGMFQPPCEEKLLGLRFEGPPETPLLVHGDQGKLRQVLINLLGNAVKFTRDGRITLRAAQRSREGWHFEVEDTGPGIAGGEREAIFEPFRQGAQTGGQSGTGLGLTIARRQAELMGGVLELAATSPQGSLFTCTLTLAPATAQLAARPAPPRQERLAEGCKVRALVVDDIPENREVLALLLRAAGCEVSLAENGRQALEGVRLSQPEIVFMDMRLPDGDGAEVIRQMIREYRAAGLKLVATSASALVHQREQYLAAGADDFLAKPFRAERLYGALERLLGVTFVGQSTLPLGEAAEIVNLSSIALPEELATRLVMAAELHSATVLKSCLNEVEAFGPAGARLAEHLRGFLASYDMASIQRLVAQIPVTVPSAVERQVA